MTKDVRFIIKVASACCTRRSDSESSAEVGLVENQDRRVLQQGARDGEALPLAARKTLAALADHGRVAVGLRQDEIVGVGGACGSFDLPRGCAGRAVGNVAGDSIVEQTVSCVTMPICSRSDASVTSRMSRPSIVIVPLVTS
jgi:hypothetical protein